MTTASLTCACASDDCRQNGCLIMRNRVMAPDPKASLPPEDLDPDATYTCPHCSGTGEIDGHGHINSPYAPGHVGPEAVDAIAKAAQAWAEPRMGVQTARQLAEFIRGGA